MGSIMNLVMTSFGFAVSAIFIIFVLSRPLCARLRTRSFPAGWAFGAALHSIAQIERGANGMDPGAVSLVPTIKYNQDVFASIEDATCTICLISYEEKEILRILPQCGHAFHVKCIDAWLRQQSSCPICRLHLQSSPLRGDMASPLLSMAARARFSPGALPESLFEQQALSLNSSTPTLGRQSPHNCKTCNSFQGCDGSCEAHATKVPGLHHVCIDIERSMHSNSKLGISYLESKHFGDGAESPSDDDLCDTRSSISEDRRELEQQRPWGVTSCDWMTKESEEKVSHGAITEETPEGLDGRTVTSSAMVEKGGGRVCICLEETKKLVVASRVGMVGIETGGIGEGEASGSLDNQGGVNEKGGDSVDGNSSSLKERGNGSQLNQERHTFSSCIGKLQEGYMQQQKCSEAETGNTPEDVNLGWTPVTFYLSSEDDIEATTEVDGSTQINPSKYHENMDVHSFSFLPPSPSL